jgi:hypothetical protein
MTLKNGHDQVLQENRFFDVSRKVYDFTLDKSKAVLEIEVDERRPCSSKYSLYRQRQYRCKVDFPTFCSMTAILYISLAIYKLRNLRHVHQSNKDILKTY